MIGHLCFEHLIDPFLEEFIEKFIEILPVFEIFPEVFGNVKFLFHR
jgi:hypothetical protein